MVTRLVDQEDQRAPGVKGWGQGKGKGKGFGQPRGKGVKHVSKGDRAAMQSHDQEGHVEVTVQEVHRQQTWQEWQTSHGGRGWSRAKMSSEYHNHKQPRHAAPQPASPR